MWNHTIPIMGTIARSYNVDKMRDIKVHYNLIFTHIRQWTGSIGNGLAPVNRYTPYELRCHICISVQLQTPWNLVSILRVSWQLSHKSQCDIVILPLNSLRSGDYNMTTTGDRFSNEMTCQIGEIHSANGILYQIAIAITRLYATTGKPLI